MIFVFYRHLSIVILVMIVFVWFQFVGVEAIITVIYDMFPRYLRRGYNKEIFIGFYIILTYFIGLTMVTNVSGL